MAILDQLKIANVSAQQGTSPVGRFRRRLVEALDLQAELAKAETAGMPFSRTRQRWVRTEGGGKELRDLPVRVRRWWWQDDAGKTFFALRHGTRLLELAPGKKAIEVGTVGDLPDQLSILRMAVLAGELDACAGSTPEPRKSVAKKEKVVGAATKPTKPS